MKTSWIALSVAVIPAYNDIALKTTEISNDHNRSPLSFPLSYFEFDRFWSAVRMFNTAGSTALSHGPDGWDAC
jgi:hypothetical protein